MKNLTPITVTTPLGKKKPNDLKKDQDSPDSSSNVVVVVFYILMFAIGFLLGWILYTRNKKPFSKTQCPVSTTFPSCTAVSCPVCTLSPQCHVVTPNVCPIPSPCPTSTPFVCPTPTACPVVTASPCPTVVCPVVTTSPPSPCPTSTPVVCPTPTACPVVTASPCPTVTPSPSVTPCPTITPCPTSTPSPSVFSSSYTSNSGFNESSSQNIYLDRHNVDCQAKNAIRGISFSTGTLAQGSSSIGVMRFNYSCSSGNNGILDSTRTSRSTSVQDDGCASSSPACSIRFLDRHPVSCAPGEVLSQFQLGRTDSNGTSTGTINNIRFNYQCIPVTNKTLTFRNNIQTFFTAGSDVKDFQNLNFSCNSNEVLQYLKLASPTSTQMMLNATCCS